MIRLLDGPAAGKMGLRRAPVFLRATVDTATGKIDALDQLDDLPRPTEVVHVYQAVPGTVFNLRADIIVCTRDGIGGMASGDYRHRADVDGEQLREAGPWQRWAIDEASRQLNDRTAAASR